MGGEKMVNFIRLEVLAEINALSQQTAHAQSPQRQRQRWWRRLMKNNKSWKGFQVRLDCECVCVCV